MAGVAYTRADCLGERSHSPCWCPRIARALPLLLLVVTGCGERGVAKPAIKSAPQIYRSTPSEYHARLKAAFMDELGPTMEEAAPAEQVAIRIAVNAAAGMWSGRLVQELTLGEDGTCTWQFSESKDPAYNSGEYMAELSPLLVRRVYTGRWIRNGVLSIGCTFDMLDGDEVDPPREESFEATPDGALRLPDSMRDLPFFLQEAPLRRIPGS